MSDEMSSTGVTDEARRLVFKSFDQRPDHGKPGARASRGRQPHEYRGNQDL
jgi:hypothetical protein